MISRKQLVAVLVLSAATALTACAQDAEIDAAQSQLKAAQEKSDWAAVVQYAVEEGNLLVKALAGTKPDTTSDDFWTKSQERWRAMRVQAEYACFDASLKETIPAKRVKLLEQLIASFDGDYSKQALPTLAGAYQQSGDTAKAIATAKRSLAVDPNNEGLHLLIADSDLSSKQLPSAIEHAREAVKILGAKKKPDGYTDDAWTAYTKSLGGSAHSIAGMALMQQDKPADAIPELKSAADMLAGNQQALGGVLYNLAFAYAKQKRTAEARAVLVKAVAIPGPFQKLSKDLAAQIK